MQLEKEQIITAIIQVRKEPSEYVPLEIVAQQASLPHSMVLRYVKDLEAEGKAIVFHKMQGRVGTSSNEVLIKLTGS